MRHWLAPATPLSSPATGFSSIAGVALGGMVAQLGEHGFAAQVLAQLSPLLPAGSWSVYRTGGQRPPTLFMSASHGIPDTTRDCWWAYLSGPYQQDRTWGDVQPSQPAALMCHLTAGEVEGEHRSRVYEAHGMAERVSIADQEDDGARFAVNFYRHQHQPPFRDGQISDLAQVAPVLLALARKHIALAQPRSSPALPLPAAPAKTLPTTLPALRQRLLQAQADLTERELDVCARMLQGLTQEGIAQDLNLSLATVKTYRNRAFQRLGIHFRNELFALALRAPV